MRKSKKKSNRILLLIIVLAVFIIITVVNIVVINNKKTDTNNENQVTAENTVSNDVDFQNALEEVEEEFLEAGQIVPENYNFLVRLYSGPVDSSDLYDKLYSVIYTDIPNINNNLYGKTDGEITEYFNSNYQDIMDKFGIEDVNNFKNFVLKVTQIKDAKYVSSSLDVANYKEENDYAYVDLDVKYSNNKEVKLTIKLSNSENNNSIIIY